MLWSNTGATNYNVKLGYTDKGHTNNMISFGCYLGNIVVP